MNIRTLKIFSDLVDNANFSRTARQNNISQSAISQKVKTLEARLKINLLEKKQKAFSLTEEGLIFYKHAKLILSQYNDMIENLKCYDAKISEGVNLLTSHWIGIHILPHYIREYLKVFKNSNLNIHYVDYTRIQMANLDLRSDLIILELPSNGDEFVCEPFAEDRFSVIYSECIHHRKPKSFALHDLASIPLVGFVKNHPLRSILERSTGKKKVHFRYFMEFNQIEPIKQAIEVHNAMAILPSSILTFHESRTLQAVPLTDMIPITLYLIYRKNCQISCATRHFIEILKGKSLLSE
ncbi:MAG: LysR family transcriptional regulator [Puniceicoccales bacterium]|jgi:DNA-binding transcriptional LysR family regulator|nr:LysR family transcriptional regulator [Puniceicoccales bacterium]